jgi:hypothetical protein
VIVGAHDPQPAAALSFVDVWQFACLKSPLVVGKPVEHEVIQVIHVGPVAVRNSTILPPARVRA